MGGEDFFQEEERKVSPKGRRFRQRVYTKGYRKKFNVFENRTATVFEAYKWEGDRYKMQSKR